MTVYLLIKCEPYYRGDAETAHATLDSAKAKAADRGATDEWEPLRPINGHEGWRTDHEDRHHWWEIHEHEVQA